MVPLIRLCLRGVLLSPVHCNSSTLISAFKRSPSATLEGCQVSSALLTCRATDGPRTYLWSRQQGAVPEGWGSAPAQHCSTAVQDLLSGFSEPCTLQLQEWGSYTGRIAIETCTHTLMARFFSTALRKKIFKFKHNWKYIQWLLLCTATKKQKQRSKPKDRSQQAPILNSP